MCRVNQVARDAALPAIRLSRASKHDAFRLQMKATQKVHLIAAQQPSVDIVPFRYPFSNETYQNHSTEYKTHNDQAFMTPSGNYRSPLQSPPPLELPTSTRPLEPMPHLLPKEILVPEF